jgi:uncharacterized membrane protein YoaK (UPF0700 family)
MNVQRPLELIVATSLTAIAGFVDAVGFLAFAKVYTANMSGNSVALGIAIAQGNWPATLFRVWPILLYVFGLIFGRAILARGARRGSRHIARVAIGCEVVLLLSALSVGMPRALAEGRSYLAVAFLATAMGIQNSTLTRFNSETLHTGFVTGTLVKMAEQFVAYLDFLSESLRNGRPLRSSLVAGTGERSFQTTLFLAMIWFVYVAGAALGTWRESTAHSLSLLFPIAGLAALIAVDYIQPLANRDQQDQKRLDNHE